MPTPPYTLVPRLSEHTEPEPTEEDERRMEEVLRRMRAERQAAREAGERLPPFPAGIWKTRD